MPAKRVIRSKYREIIRALATEHRTTLSGYEISRDATTVECIGYAERYIVGRTNSTPHYRYDRYWGELYTEFLLHPMRSGTVIHVDVGCGPGLFTWVARDYFRNVSRIKTSFYGYDHAPNMKKLAVYLWNQFEGDTDYLCYHELSESFDNLEKECAANSYVIVTFGHVLVQTVDNAAALGEFARIIAKCARIANCLVMAVDAKTGDRPKDFHRALGGLKTSLENRGLTIELPPEGASSATCRVRRTNWA